MADKHTQPGESDALKRLAALAAAVGAAGEDVAKAEGVVEDILGLVAELPKDTAKALMNRPEIQELIADAAEAKAVNTGRQPGSAIIQVIAGVPTAVGKVPWTWRDLQTMPTKSFTPNERIVLIWNGLSVGLEADVETTLPEVFYGEYMHRKHRIAIARQWCLWFFKIGNPPPPHPEPESMTLAEVTARESMHAGLYRPGAGLDQQLRDSMAAQREVVSAT